MINKPDASNRVIPGLLPSLACSTLPTFYLHPSFLSIPMILRYFKKLEIVPSTHLSLKKKKNGMFGPKWAYTHTLKMAVPLNVLNDILNSIQAGL